MYVSFYRRYRPQRFADVVGQGAATSLLRLSFREKRLSHAYLFSGPRGCGKTTVARLLAKALNCANPGVDGEPCCECDSCKAVTAGEHLDVMEIDGASNRGIDQIRELKSHVSLAPFIGEHKTYILDEVHMLTQEAFNALLKTLEEPPPPVIFLFATTEPHKVPATVRSRCQHVPFHRISTAEIAGHLRHIAGIEGFAAEDAALWEIARQADGALRDALSLTEQAVSLGGGALTREVTRRFFGGGSRGEMEELMRLWRENPPKAAALLRDLFDRGVSPERFLDGLYVLLRDMWVFSLWGDGAIEGIAVSQEEREYLVKETPYWRPSRLRELCGFCSGLFTKARWGLSSDVFSGLVTYEFQRGPEVGAQVSAAQAPAMQVQVAPVSGRQTPAAQLPRESAAAAQAAVKQAPLQAAYKSEYKSELPLPTGQTTTGHAPTGQVAAQVQVTHESELPASAAQTPMEQPAAPQMAPASGLPAPQRASAEEPLAAQPPLAPPLVSAAPATDGSNAAIATPMDVFAAAGGSRLFEPFWTDDLLLCAALTDAAVYVTGEGSLRVDSSRSVAAARSLLESPRYKLKLARAYGTEKAEEPAAAEPPAPPRKGELPVASGVDTGKMSPLELARYIGGELLALKPLSDDGDNELREIEEID